MHTEAARSTDRNTDHKTGQKKLQGATEQTAPSEIETPILLYAET